MCTNSTLVTLFTTLMAGPDVAPNPNLFSIFAGNSFYSVWCSDSEVGLT